MDLNNYFKNCLISFLLVVCFFPGLVFSDDLDTALGLFTANGTRAFYNSRNIIDPRAEAMGGAVLALTDNPSNIFYNPAALWYREKSVLEFRHGAISLIRPIDKIWRGWSISKLYEYHTSTDYENYACYRDDIDYYEFALPFTWRINEKVSLGYTFSLFWKRRDMKFSRDFTWEDPWAEQPDYFEFLEKGDGYRIVYGLLVKPLPNISLGMRYQPKTLFKIRAKYLVLSYDYRRESEEQIDASETLPSSLGVGAVYNLASNFLIAYDLDYTCWSEVRRRENREIIQQSLKDVIEHHLGTEYVIKDKLPLRAGLYYDADNVLNGKNNNQLFFTLGTGYKWGNLGIDFSFSENSLLKNNNPVENRRNLSFSWEYGLTRKEELLKVKGPGFFSAKERKIGIDFETATFLAGPINNDQSLGGVAVVFTYLRSTNNWGGKLYFGGYDASEHPTPYEDEDVFYMFPIMINYQWKNFKTFRPSLGAGLSYGIYEYSSGRLPYIQDDRNGIAPLLTAQLTLFPKRFLQLYIETKLFLNPQTSRGNAMFLSGGLGFHF